MQFRWILGSALVLSAAGVTACSGDDTVGVLPDSGSSADAGNGSDATTADGGSRDTGTGTDGQADTSTAPGDGGAEASEDGAADAGDAAGSAYAIFVGTDFSNAELSVVDLSTNVVAGNLALQDEDSVAYASGGLGFVLERGLGDIVSLNPAQPWTARATIDVNDSPDAAAYASNPHAIVVTTGTKAYVARYSSNVVDIVDVASGASTGTIDLSPFVAPGSPDGLVDVTDGAYDPTSQRAYLLLQRINQYDFGPPPDYVGGCLPWHGEIVAVDAVHDAIVSLTDAGTNGAIDLLGDNPQALTPDFANGRFVIAEGGCDEYPDGGSEDAGPVARIGRGIEVVSLATATPAWLYQTGSEDLLSAVLLADGTHAYVQLGSEWFPWDPTQTTATVGTTAVANFPQAPFYGGNGQVIGLWPTEPDAGSDASVEWSVVAMATATGNLSTLVASPFKNVVPATEDGVTSAIVP